MSEARFSAILSLRGSRCTSTLCYANLSFTLGFTWRECRAISVLIAGTYHLFHALHGQENISHGT